MKACIVTGDRHAEWRHWHEDVADAIAGFDVVIHGAAKGIDTIADNVADELVTKVIPMPAPWAEMGNAAGPHRNRCMLNVLLNLKDCGYVVEVLAFHSNIEESKGTRNMVAMARGAEVKVTVCKGRYS